MLDIFKLRKGAIFRLVYGCNHHCNFCHERDNILSLEFTMITLADIDRIRTWLFANQFDYVILSGGECSFHPHLSQIIAELQKDFYVIVISNGTNIDRHDLSRIGENITFYLSFHGLSEVYNSITHSNDFDSLVLKIRNLSQLGHIIILRCVLNAINIHQADEIVEFVMREFTSNVYLEFVLLEDLKHSHVKETSISLNEYLQVVL
jgi:molybdenum cofactor biosynthesis enzyme MoaA